MTPKETSSENRVLEIDDLPTLETNVTRVAIAPRLEGELEIAGLSTAFSSTSVRDAHDDELTLITDHRARRGNG